MNELKRQAVAGFLWKEECLVENIHDRPQTIFKILRRHSQVFTSGPRSSSASKKTLLISHAQDGPRSTIWTLTIHLFCGTVHSGPCVQLLKKWASNLTRCTNDWQSHWTPVTSVKKGNTLSDIWFEEETGWIVEEVIGNSTFRRTGSFYRAITGSESWLVCNYSGDHLWVCATDDVPQRISHQIQSERLRLVMLWSTRGLIIVKWMEQDYNFNITYFINEIVNEWVINLKTTGNFTSRKWYRFRLNSSRLTISQKSVDSIDQHKFMRLPHPPESPDLTPSDFLEFSRGDLRNVTERWKRSFSEMLPKIQFQFQAKSLFKDF
jgi:hypothetical protein